MPDHPDTEAALKDTTLALFRQMGWDTVNCIAEVFGNTPASLRRPNLGRETKALCYYLGWCLVKST